MIEHHSKFSYKKPVRSDILNTPSAVHFKSTIDYQTANTLEDYDQAGDASFISRARPTEKSDL